MFELDSNIQCKENDSCIDDYNKQSFGMKSISYLLQLESCIDMFKVISDIMDVAMISIINILHFNAKKIISYAIIIE